MATGTNEYRLCNTPDLRLLASRAGRNGREPSAHLRAQLDPDGTHVLHMELFGHNLDKPGSVLSHRVRVLARVTGTEEPVEAWLDIRDSDWRRLHRYEASSS